MDVIIDGYNLLALDKRLDRGLEQSRNALIRTVAHYRACKPWNVIVVFDGWRSGSASETILKQDGVIIVYSRLGEKADAVIVRIAREKGSGCVVVSSDREIRNDVERFGAVAIHAQEFSAILQTLDGANAGEDSEDRNDDGPTAGASHRLSKTERKRQEKLRKLRL